MAQQITRKKDTGEAGNGGHFGTTSRGEADVHVDLGPQRGDSVESLYEQMHNPALGGPVEFTSDMYDGLGEGGKVAVYRDYDGNLQAEYTRTMHLPSHRLRDEDDEVLADFLDEREIQIDSFDTDTGELVIRPYGDMLDVEGRTGMDFAEMLDEEDGGNAARTITAEEITQHLEEREAAAEAEDGDDDEDGGYVSPYTDPQSPLSRAHSYGEVELYDYRPEDEWYDEHGERLRASDVMREGGVRATAEYMGTTDDGRANRAVVHFYSGEGDNEGHFAVEVHKGVALSAEVSGSEALSIVADEWTCARDHDSFESFAMEYGYETDYYEDYEEVLAARRQWAALNDQADRAEEFFGREALDRIAYGEG